LTDKNHNCILARYSRPPIVGLQSCFSQRRPQCSRQMWPVLSADWMRSPTQRDGSVFLPGPGLIGPPTATSSIGMGIAQRGGGGVSAVGALSGCFSKRNRMRGTSQVIGARKRGG